MDNVTCQKCYFMNPPSATQCQRCGASLIAQPTALFQTGKVYAGRYTLKTCLGAGGMGEVWTAEQAGIGREVAIKFLHPELMRHPTAKKRVLSEAKAIGSLHHTNIIQIFDFFEAESTVGLVLELIQGGSLADRIDQGAPLPSDEVGSLMSGVLKGLHALHTQGMIHRDIKPDNVLISKESGQLVPKITDFGIAQQDNGTRLTRDGSRLGTPEYMAPEQIKAGTTSVASDIYACGIMMFEMLAGRVPFTGTDYEIQHGHVERDVDLSVLPPQTPEWMKTVIITAMAKDPAQRYADAEAFRAAIDAEIRSEGTSTVPASIADHPSQSVTGSPSSSAPTPSRPTGPDSPLAPDSPSGGSGGGQTAIMIVVGLLIAAVAAYLYWPTERKRSRDSDESVTAASTKRQNHRTESTKTSDPKDPEYSEMDALEGDPHYGDHHDEAGHEEANEETYVAPVPALPPPAGPDWYCVCYHEKVRGSWTPVTSCRPSSGECDSLQSKIVNNESRIMTPGANFKACTYVGWAATPQDRLGSAHLWKPSSKPGSYWSPHGCHLN